MAAGTLRDKILAAQDIPTEVVTIPEWGVDVLVRGMSAGDRITLMQNAFDQTTQQVNMNIVYPDVVISCTFDPASDQAIFTDEDKSAILAKSSAAVERLANVGLRLSGIGKDEQDAAGKDSSKSQNEDSPSS
jgi:hypothetical protein